jgi:protein SCO1/2
MSAISATAMPDERGRADGYPCSRAAAPRIKRALRALRTDLRPQDAWYHFPVPPIVTDLRYLPSCMTAAARRGAVHRRRRPGGSAGIGAALLALLLAACTSSGPPYALANVRGLVSPLRFHLTDQDGHPVTAADYRNDVVLLYFGYTQCPDQCPTTLTTLANALHALGPGAAQVRVLFVSVDPRRDSTEVLKRYVGNFGPQFIGLRGDPAELTRLSKRYRISYHYEAPDKYGNYEVDHSSAVFVFDRHGRARLLGQADNTAPQYTADLRRLLARS